MIDVNKKGVSPLFPEHTGVELIILMCNAALSIERQTLKPASSQSDNPFLAPGPHGRLIIDAFYAVQFHDAAKATLRQIECDSRLPNHGFVSLEEVFVRSARPVRLVRKEVFTATSPAEMWHSFIHECWNEFSQCADSVYRLVYHGLDLYTVSNDNYQRVARNHPDRVFLHQLGKRGITYHFKEFPDWARLYYFDAAHIELRDIFLEHDYTPEQFDIKLRAFHREIGVDDTSPAREYAKVELKARQTRMLEIVQLVLEKHAKTPLNQYPKAAVLVDELQSSFGLSKREADAIDIVTRPDALRGKT